MLQIEKSNRRNTILATILIPVLQIIPNANATTEIPEGIFNNLYNNFKHLLGYKLQNDILDNYSFFVKDDWTRISTTPNDIAFHALRNPSQNLFVSVSSPSTSNYASVRDLGTPEDTADDILKRYLNEFMSTRIGIRREGEKVSAKERIKDGRPYYDIELKLRSYASRKQFGITEEERQSAVELEWSRIFYTVLGVANKRLYEFRIQTDDDTPASQLEILKMMAMSFECKDKEV